MSFWENFERICKERGTTPTAVVKNGLGLSASKVTMWKNGSLPKEDILNELAKVLNCKVSDFFADTPLDVKVVIDTTGSMRKPDLDEEYVVQLIRSCDFADKHDFMSQCVNFDRSRGLGVADQFARNLVKTDAALQQQKVSSMAARLRMAAFTSNQAREINKIALETAQAAAALPNLPRGIFRVKKKNKATGVVNKSDLITVR